MLLFRAILLLCLVGAIVCFGLFIATGQARFKILGLKIVRGCVLAGLAFFGVLVLERVL